MSGSDSNVRNAAICSSIASATGLVERVQRRVAAVNRQVIQADEVLRRMRVFLEMSDTRLVEARSLPLDLQIPDRQTSE